jgi:hypothetical protein
MIYQSRIYIYIDLKTNRLIIAQDKMYRLQLIILF